MWLDIRPSEELEKAQCTGCAKLGYVEMDNTPYDDVLLLVQDSLMAELEGDWILSDDKPEGKYLQAVSKMILTFQDVITEARTLQKGIDQLLDVFPDTFYPIPLLLRRLTRILIHLPHPKLGLAIEYLVTATLALRDVHQGEPRPIISSMLLDKVDAHLKAACILLDQQQEGGHGGKKGSDGKVWKSGRVSMDSIDLHVREGEETIEMVEVDLRELARDGGVSWSWSRVDRLRKELKRIAMMRKELLRNRR
jgi:hypothetical protein